MFGVVAQPEFSRGDRSLMIRHAKLSSSKRLQRVCELLSDAQEHSTLEICIRAGVCAVNSIVAELRAQGADIRCRQVRSKETGERIWVYRMVRPVEEVA